ncbi:MAG: phosphoribosylformylglycinamidine cyclo-ligase [Phycisphaerae bacterium]|nr:phosphoribosylformylglycinamidine cyclo-ligase [Phycisphaerae bacterium]
MISYKQSGVDIDAKVRWVESIESAMRSTYGPRVPKMPHGLFAGAFRLDYDEQLFRRNYRRPVLLGCTDGVGTKILLALQLNRLETIGIDLVAMSVNDLVACGGEPLFFLDYLAVNKLEPRRLLAVVEGIAEGCRQAGCALLGGETAQMSDLYREGELDMAGFAVGVAEQGRVIDGSRIRPGDLLVGLSSSGVHSNGYTLVRKLIASSGINLAETYPGLDAPLGDVLLRPTRIYVRAVQAVLRSYRRKRVVTGLANITGGGLKENVGRIMPPRCEAMIERRSWTPPTIFPFLQKLGVSRAEMFKVFNMGIGFVFIVRPAFVKGVLRSLKRVGEEGIVIGKVSRGSRRVRLV